MTGARIITEALGGRWHGNHGRAPCPRCQPQKLAHQSALTLADGPTGLVLRCDYGCARTDIERAAGDAFTGYQPPPRDAAPARTQCTPPGWPSPDARLLNAALPPAPGLPLDATLSPYLAAWVKATADAKGAPVDYVFAALLAVAASAIGNSRCVSPWPGWCEPPTLWIMLIGAPSAGKSPALEAALAPLRRAEAPLRAAAEAERNAWADRAEVAKVADAAWRDDVKVAVKSNTPPPPRPAAADAGAPPHVPRLVIADATIEKLASILARQPRGILQCRDELAGWLENMSRYSGGSDRAFWLEAYGGRSYTVERMGRDPLTVERLTAGVLGGIQPDRLRTLLANADDDGLVARFMPAWPEPAPVRRPSGPVNDAVIDRVIARLLALNFAPDGAPVAVPFNEGAREQMDRLRHAVRGWEADAEGLLLSFIGKLPGLAARLSLVLMLIDWASGTGAEPVEIDADTFDRAARLVEHYALPMARRAYSEAAMPKTERAARRLVGIIRECGWSEFSSRDVMRMDRAGLSTAAEVNPAIARLIEGDVIRGIEAPARPQGGRPAKAYAVNPAIHQAAVGFVPKVGSVAGVNGSAAAPRP